MKELFMTTSVHVLIGLVILAIVVYVAIFITQRLTIRRVEALQTKKQQLLDLDTDTSLLEGQKMSLTGKSLKQFEQLQTAYNEVETQDFLAFDEKADEVFFDAKGWNVVKTRQALKELSTQLDVTAQRIVDVQKGLEDLHKIDEAHRAAVTQLESEYQALRKTLLTRNFEYGDSIDKLEEILGSLEDDFDEFSRLTAQGDHTAASDIYAQLHSETEKLENMIDAIPAIEKELSGDFVDQITELQDAYQKLLAEGYVFPDGDAMAAQIAELENTRQSTALLLNDLHVDEAADLTTKLSARIDDVYDAMQLELDAKKTAKQSEAQLDRFIEHAKHQNHSLLMELDRLGQRYIMTKGEIDATRELSEQIKKVGDTFRKERLDMQMNAAVYSEVAEKFAAAQAQLTAIENDHAAIWDSVQGLTEAEKSAQSTLEEAAFDLRDIKREVEHWNLPGLPVNYKKQYQNVTREIDKLYNDMQAIRINMTDVANQLNVIKSDLDSLHEATASLKLNANLTEQLMQYANRYRLQNDKVATAYDQAMDEYQHTFDYDKAQQILGAAVDSAEAGAYEKIKAQM
ncbi:septation ring formation regulator EzrA [Periweissella cryptocerci]|uniref:Septation ring formation regulator EzrA n=1 Tax=Periweissella cryptocerci TaxID=2506420 RepID=A0A4P6YSK3_9LACO|nr:septation ring formation regulator EzrA [Periweissella cryptocerci]QBO35630.1 septation ring formation regulator EzrA [Periweissella cryptocerci]